MVSIAREQWHVAVVRTLCPAVVHFAHRDRRGTSDALADRAVCREISSATRNKAPKLPWMAECDLRNGDPLNHLVSDAALNL